MWNMKSSAFAAALVLAMAPLSLSAQQSPSQAPSQQQMQTPAPGSSAQQGDSALKPGQGRISEWFDLEIQTADGTEVGELEDLVIENNRITAAVVELERGGLGIGERRVLIPIDSIRRSGDRLVVDLTREQLQALPELRSD
jgi:sporulation protein YlmC with PRC-barrel domain